MGAVLFEHEMDIRRRGFAILDMATLLRNMFDETPPDASFC
jgi:hypothetical protein